MLRLLKYCNMQVFIIGTPLETAKALDYKRLNKQIVECKQILDAMENKTPWSNHLCTLQYKPHKRWLMNYMACLIRYREGELERAEVSNAWCNGQKPPFHTVEFLEQMKRRLYTKDPIYYAQWMNLGTSEVNWYFVNGSWRYYKDGKRVEYSR